MKVLELEIMMKGKLEALGRSIWGCTRSVLSPILFVSCCGCCH